MARLGTIHAAIKKNHAREALCIVGLRIGVLVCWSLLHSASFLEK
jgi:hypothetical protein